MEHEFNITTVSPCQRRLIDSGTREVGQDKDVKIKNLSYIMPETDAQPLDQKARLES